jgi:hypothetical protein
MVAGDVGDSDRADRGGDVLSQQTHRLAAGLEGRGANGLIPFDEVGDAHAAVQRPLGGAARLYRVFAHQKRPTGLPEPPDGFFVADQRPVTENDPPLTPVSVAIAPAPRPGRPLSLRRQAKSQAALALVAQVDHSARRRRLQAPYVDGGEVGVAVSHAGFSLWAQLWAQTRQKAFVGTVVGTFQ